MKILNYDEEQIGNDTDYTLINNGQITNNETGEILTIGEIKQLQLFINPISAEVYRFIENVFCKDDKYEYCSY